MTRRAEQIASLLRTAVQEVIARGFQDPRIRGLITITDLTVSPDLKAATIMVSILPEDRQELTMHGLRAAATHIRHQISDRLDLRVTPDLHFKLDNSLKKQAGVFEALAKIAEERASKEAAAAPASDDAAPGAPVADAPPTVRGSRSDGPGARSSPAQEDSAR